MKIEQAKKIAEKFCSTDKERPALTSVFVRGNRVYATNGYSAIRVECEDTAPDEGHENFPQKGVDDLFEKWTDKTAAPFDLSVVDETSLVEDFTKARAEWICRIQEELRRDRREIEDTEFTCYCGARLCIKDGEIVHIDKIEFGEPPDPIYFDYPVDVVVNDERLLINLTKMMPLIQAVRGLVTPRVFPSWRTKRKSA